MRETAIKYREDSLFLSCSDKAKIDYGEPGYALSTGVHGRKSIVSTTFTLGALDHDGNQKGSLTPTVTLACKILESTDKSFYSGQVFVTFKDSVFQPSTSFRSTLELYEPIQLLPSLTDAKRLFMVTDGGSEHNVSHESVKIPLILLFLRLNLDMLVAIRTAHGHSYRNPVERTMSILNIGFQNVSMERAATNQEEIIKQMKNLEDLRKGADKIKNAWIDSVQPLIDLLGDRVRRLILKEQPFMVKKFTSTCLLITQKLSFRFYNTLLFYTIRWFLHMEILPDTGYPEKKYLL